MNDNSGLGAFAGAPIEVNACDGLALKRISRSNDFSVVWVCGHKIAEELQMVCVGVVGVEPRLVRGARWSTTSQR